MKLLVALCLALLALAWALPIAEKGQSVDAVAAELIKEVNADEDSSWTAGVNHVFAGMTMREVREKMLGLLMDRKYHHVPVKTHSHIADSAIPESFNAYEAWPEFCHPIRDQAHCGSCWAFAASEVLSDRFAIASNGTMNNVLSPEDLVSCDSTDMGCQGGYLDHAWEYLKDTGIVTDTCFPYSAQKGKPAMCVNKCLNDEPFVKYKVSDFYQLKTEEDIQKDIMTNGPVEAGFVVYTSFMAYKSGVYHKKILDMPEGGHAIKIVGWGIEPPKRKWQKPMKYWLCANSWTDKWGMNGFFKIKRGINMRGQSECDIQGNVFAGHPLLTPAPAPEA